MAKNRPLITALKSAKSQGLMTKSSTYTGTRDYVASQELQEVVNVSLSIGRPLLIKGEPGTGKTLLAGSIATALNRPLIRWNIKSTTKGIDGLYVYDTVQRLNDSRFGDGDVSDIKHYIKLGKLGEAFTAKEPVVLLIDEIDKADLEFPNDLLAELDEMRFHIPETKQEITAEQRPMVVITSNSEKELPDAFLRRCVFHFIEFPEPAMMAEILKVHFPEINKRLMESAVEKFYEIRARHKLRKPPSTSELIDWLHALISMGADAKSIAGTPLIGCLLKNEQDLEQVS